MPLGRVVLNCSGSIWLLQCSYLSHINSTLTLSPIPHLSRPLQVTPPLSPHSCQAFRASTWCWAHIWTLWMKLCSGSRSGQTCAAVPDASMWSLHSDYVKMVHLRADWKNQLQKHFFFFFLSISNKLLDIDMWQVIYYILHAHLTGGN